MGHERVGYLPKTKKWTSIVERITAYSFSSNNNAAEISYQTTKNVRYKFEGIQNDSGVKAAFEFIIFLTMIPKKENWKEYLAKKGINLSEKFSLIETVSKAKEYIQKNQESKEYSAFAIQAISDVISQWGINNSKQGNLFDVSSLQTEIWRRAADGGGFCEISRMFFAKFTERYLKYFLEREAHGRINNLFDLNSFNNNIENNIQDISKHAFETAKITQSFAAGWYNKYIKDNLPDGKELKNFIDYSFQKLGKELLREQISE